MTTASWGRSRSFSPTSPIYNLRLPSRNARIVRVIKASLQLTLHSTGGQPVEGALGVTIVDQGGFRTSPNG